MNGKEAIKHIHLIGIGGSGMSGIAEVLLNQGYHVSGSDITANATTERLQDLGAAVYQTHSESNLQGSNIVVISSAIDENNPELIAAHKAHVPVIARAEMLSQLMSFQKGIAVAGTHGKTTTTSLVASILAEAGLDPTFVIGGLLKSAGANAYLGKSQYFVAEADESDGSFLFLHPEIAIVTNIDADHLGTYENNFSKLKQAFFDFLRQLPFNGLAVLCVDDPVVESLLQDVARPVKSYGFNENTMYQIVDFQQTGVTSAFYIKQKNKELLKIKLNLPGHHNALNATAAAIVAKHLGVSDEAIQRALANFGGIERRFQVYGEYQTPNGRVLLIDDYGHHPSEINATLNAIRGAWPSRRLVVAFQPHRYTRTAALFDDFAEILSRPDVLLLLGIYSAGETPIQGADGAALYSAICKKGCVESVFIEHIERLPNKLNDVLKDGDVLLTLGAGSIGKMAKYLADNKLSF